MKHRYSRKNSKSLVAQWVLHFRTVVSITTWYFVLQSSIQIINVGADNTVDVSANQMFPIDTSKQKYKKGKPHDVVVQLTSSNFVDFVESDPANGLWFIKFEAPWCPHCAKLSPMLDKIAKYMKGRMSIGQVDCTTEVSICKGGLPGKENWNIEHYPSIKIYRDGSYFDYSGELKPDPIIEFGEKMSRNLVGIISSIEDAYDGTILKQAVVPASARFHTDEQSNNANSNKIAFVAYDPNAKEITSSDKLYDTLQSTKTLQVFNQVARKQQAHAKFGLIAPNASIEEIQKFGVSDNQNPFIGKIEKNVPGTMIFYNGDLTSGGLNDFVKDQNHELVCKLDGNNIRDIGALGKALIIGVFDPDDEANESTTSSNRTSTFKNNIFDYAKEMAPTSNSNKHKFCIMDGKKHEMFLRQFDIHKGNLPEFFALDYVKREYYNQEINNSTPATMATIQEFIQSIENGDLTKKFQQQQPQYNSSGENLTFDYIQNIFIQYMPWSGLGSIMILAFAVVLFFTQDSQEDGNDVQEQLESDLKKKAL